MNKGLLIIFSSIFLSPFFSVTARAHELGPYWFGYGVGSLGAICGLQKIGVLTSESVASFKEGMVQELRKQDPSITDIESFFKAEQLVKQNAPSCGI